MEGNKVGEKRKEWKEGENGKERGRVGGGGWREGEERREGRKEGMNRKEWICGKMIWFLFIGYLIYQRLYTLCMLGKLSHCSDIILI